MVEDLDVDVDVNVDLVSVGLEISRDGDEICFESWFKFGELNGE